jgi:hypothetical protein
MTDQSCNSELSASGNCINELTIVMEMSLLHVLNLAVMLLI